MQYGQTRILTDLEPGVMPAVYRALRLSRRLDERLMTLLKQGKSHFHIGSSGHEAAQVAASMLFDASVDWAFPYYRDLPFVLQWGMTPLEVFLHAFGKAQDPSSGGRQMPSHWGHRDLNIFTQSSPTGTQYLHAVGVAMGLRHQDKPGIIYVSSGEGTTSQGDFFEAINQANRERLPIMFHVQNNGYEISVPFAKQCAGVPLHALINGYSNFYVAHVDGTDFFAAFETMRKAMEHICEGKGPALVVSDTVRLTPHSSSADHRKYRSEDDLKAEADRDPMLVFRRKCSEMGCMTSAQAQAVDDAVEEVIRSAENQALEAPDPDPSTARLHLYSSDRESESVSVDIRPDSAATQGGTDSIVMIDAINHALIELLETDPGVVVYGEDVEDGKGGVFGATRGLSARFGTRRVFNSPLAESTIIGSAIGMAASGLKPVVEIQFVDFLWPAFNQLKSELATIRYRSNGAWKAPVVIRTPVGGYIHGGLYHSQNQDAIFAHVPGLRVVYPSNAADAKRLLKYAVACDDPVIFLEHKALYRQRFAASPEPGPAEMLQFGKARLVREGTELTVVSWGMQVHRVVQAVAQTGTEGRVEVMDLRTLNPLDWPAIERSVAKTGKLLVVHEDHLTCGFGAEISALAADRCFKSLDGPIRRVAAADTHNPYHPALEAAVLPQLDDIAQSISELLDF